MDKFVLVRRQPDRSKQSGKQPVVRVRQDVYRQLLEWAVVTRCSLSELACRAIMYAAEHADVVDE